MPQPLSSKYKGTKRYNMTLLREKFPQYFEARDDNIKTVGGKCLVAIQDMFTKFLSPESIRKLFYMSLFYTDLGYPF